MNHLKGDNTYFRIGSIFLKSTQTLYLFIRQVKPYFMGCNLHTCNCLPVLMIAWLLVEQLIKALVNQNVFKLFRFNDTVATITTAAPLEGLI